MGWALQIIFFSLNLLRSFFVTSLKSVSDWILQWLLFWTLLEFVHSHGWAKEFGKFFYFCKYLFDLEREIVKAYSLHLNISSLFGAMNWNFLFCLHFQMLTYNKSKLTWYQFFDNSIISTCKSSRLVQNDIFKENKIK